MEKNELEKAIQEQLDASIEKMIEKYEEMAGVLLSEKERDAMHWVLNQALSHGATVYQRIGVLQEVMEAFEPTVRVVAVPVDKDSPVGAYIMSDGNKNAEELARLIREVSKDRKNPDKPAKGDDVKEQK